MLFKAWALKRGFFTAKASRPDVYRAANELLRMALDGSLCLSLKPKNFSKEKNSWQEHSETKELNKTILEVEAVAKEKKKFIPELSLNYTEESDESDEGDYENPYASFTSNKTNRIRQSNLTTESGNQSEEDLSSSSPTRNPYTLLTNE